MKEASMPIIDSKTGKIKKEYSTEDLIGKAKEMRAYNMVAITAAGSGHTGGTLSIMDVTAALYLKHINHDPDNPEWEDRDRVFWSVGHKAPAIYVALGMAGYFPVDEVVKLRKLWSGFEGHPNRFKLPGIELSSGSLGQGLGVAVGCALNARLEKKDYLTYCILGDGELNEGSVWEAALLAPAHKLENLVAIVDYNRWQATGRSDQVTSLFPLKDKFEAFGWSGHDVDGHNMRDLTEILKNVPDGSGKPIAIIAHTVKGKGISFMEDDNNWHYRIPSKEEVEAAIEEMSMS